MLGFATVDYSTDHATLTVWLTSSDGRTVTHTNAVVFQLDDPDFDPVRAEQMVVDRYVVLTGRTAADAGPLASWVDLAPCDIATLVDLIQAEQELIRAKVRSGVDDLPRVPADVDQAALDAQPPAKLTLAVANHVGALWRAWMDTEAERMRRRKSLPPDHDAETFAELPETFTQTYRPHPSRVWA